MYANDWYWNSLASGPAISTSYMSQSYLTWSLTALFPFSIFLNLAISFLCISESATSLLCISESCYFLPLKFLILLLPCSIFLKLTISFLYISKSRYFHALYFQISFHCRSCFLSEILGSTTRLQCLVTAVPLAPHFHANDAREIDATNTKAGNNKSRHYNGTMGNIWHCIQTCCNKMPRSSKSFGLCFAGIFYRYTSLSLLWALKYRYWYNTNHIILISIWKLYSRTANRLH